MLSRITDSLRFALHGLRLAGGASKPASILFRAVLVALVAAAAIVRLMRCHAGLPYVHTWDEPQTADSALHILKTGDLHPHFFTYGSVIIYLYALVDILHYLFLMGQPTSAPAFLTSLDDIKTHYETGWLWTISHPSFYLWDRYVMALAGAGAVIVSYLIAKKIGGRAAGFLAAALLGAMAVHVRHSALLTPDVMISLLAPACALLAILYLEREQPIYLVLSLVLAGLAGSTKYNAALAVLTPLTALAIAAATRSKGYRPWLWAAVPAIPAVVFLMGTPYALLDLREFLRVAGREVRVYRIYGSVGNEVDRVEPGLAHVMLQLGYFVKNLGLPGTLMALAGTAVVLTRRIGWLLVPFPLVYFYFMIGSRVPFERNYMALYPFIAAAFGAGAVLSYAWVRELTASNRRLSRALALAMIGFAALWLGQGWMRAGGEGWTALHRLETRTEALRQAGALAGQRAGDAARLGIAEELRAHPDDLRALGVAYEVRPLADLLCDADRYTLLVDGIRYGAYSPQFNDLAATWNALPVDREFHVEASVPGEVLNVDILSSDPGVRILSPKRPGAEAARICLDAAGPSGYAGIGGVEAGGGTVTTDLAGEVASPGFFVAAGGHAIVWRVAGVRPGWAPPRLRARVEAARGGGDSEVLGELIAPLSPREEEMAIRFDAADGDLVVLKLLAVGKDGAPRPDAEASLTLGPVRVLDLRGREAESP